MALRSRATRQRGSNPHLSRMRGMPLPLGHALSSPSYATSGNLGSTFWSFWIHLSRASCMPHASTATVFRLTATTFETEKNQKSTRRGGAFFTVSRRVRFLPRTKLSTPWIYRLSHLTPLRGVATPISDPPKRATPAQSHVAEGFKPAPVPCKETALAIGPRHVLARRVSV